jgi:stage II sporulation protein P
MRQGIPMLGAILLFLGTGGLFLEAGTRLSGSYETLGKVMLESQLGEAAQLVTQAAAATVAPETAQAVPVTTVEEAWDEIARETEPLTSPTTLAGDIALELRNETDYKITLTELPELPTLTQTEGEPLVLIMHTHGSEGYLESAETGYRTQEPENSVIAIGDTIAETLENMGIGVYHNKTLCDYPEYTGAYSRSRELIQEALEAYPSIALVLDVHRDAVEDEQGEQLRLACALGDETGAQLMLVAGTDAGGLEHPNWQQNLSLAAVIQTRLSGTYPELMRPLNLRRERFNQDLGTLGLLVEVGTSGNTLGEAQITAKAFAEALGDILTGCCSKSS